TQNRSYDRPAPWLAILVQGAVVRLFLDPLGIRHHPFRRDPEAWRQTDSKPACQQGQGIPAVRRLGYRPGNDGREGQRLGSVLQAQGARRATGQWLRPVVPDEQRYIHVLPLDVVGEGPWRELFLARPSSAPAIRQDSARTVG